MKILITSEIDARAEAQLRAKHEVVVAKNPPRDRLHKLIDDCDAVILRSGVNLDAPVLLGANRLSLVIRAGAGLDNVDAEFLADRGIRLEHIPSAGAQSVAELTLALMLTLARRIVEADASMRRGQWRKSELIGRTLFGKVVGVIGLGNIGARVANIAAGVGMRVIGHDDNLPRSRADQFRAAGIRLMPLDEVLDRANFITIHVPLTPDTRGLIGARELARMQPTAMLVNAARGGVVDEQALLDALSRGALSGAALDVHEQEGEGHRSPLADLPNVVLTPHIGSMTLDAQAQIGDEIVRIVENHRPVA